MHNSFDDFDSKIFTALTRESRCKWYQAIITEEARLAAEQFGNLWQTIEPEEVYNTVLQIAEIAKSGTVIRSYHKCYHLSNMPIAFESVSAHTNLMLGMLDYALDYIYGIDFRYTEDGYTCREVREAARRHDLPENITSDTPDNENRDEEAKISIEQELQGKYSSLSPKYKEEFESKVLRLLAEMEGRTSPTGKLLKTADKAAAVIIALCYDDLKLPLHRYNRDKYMTKQDAEKIKYCDRETILATGRGHNIKKAYYTSELWSLDYFKTRDHFQYDETGFFTALIVMYTLQVHGYWYSWREADYSSDYEY